MKLVFATNNLHKLREVRELIGDKFEIASLEQLGCFDDIAETEPTIEGNASLKSFYIYNKYKVDCFADDTGLEVEALNGAPGVYSARYAGEHANYAENVIKLLKNMMGIENRKARFRTVVSLILDGKEFQFEGIVDGHLIEDGRGYSGFGYDPIFMPDGFDKTFAEMDAEEKNSISHRGRAIQKLAAFLKSV